jgi:hypothetical protein
MYLDCRFLGCRKNSYDLKLQMSMKIKYDISSKNTPLEKGVWQGCFVFLNPSVEKGVGGFSSDNTYIY